MSVYPFNVSVHSLMWSDKTAEGMVGTPYTFSLRYLKEGHKCEEMCGMQEVDVCCYIHGI